MSFEAGCLEFDSRSVICDDASNMYLQPSVSPTQRSSSRELLTVKVQLFYYMTQLNFSILIFPASEDMMESIDELKERLSSMKRMMEERKAVGSGTKDLFHGEARSLRGTTMIDGNFLSFVFGGTLLVIVSVSVYAFYNLYHAVLKKFPSTHTEL